MSSGGFGVKLVEGAAAKNIGPNVTIAMLNERLNQGPNVNNFRQLAKTQFYQKAKQAGAKFIDAAVKPEMKLEDLAVYSENNLRGWKAKNPNGKIATTLALGPMVILLAFSPFLTRLHFLTFY